MYLLHYSSTCENFGRQEEKKDKKLFEASAKIVTNINAISIVRSDKHLLTGQTHSFEKKKVNSALLASWCPLHYITSPMLLRQI